MKLYFQRLGRFILTSLFTFFIFTGITMYSLYGFNYTNVPKDPPSWFSFLLGGEFFLWILYGIDLYLFMFNPNSKARLFFNWSENIESK